jgi:hypothetical protein
MSLFSRYPVYGGREVHVVWMTADANYRAGYW